MLQSQSKKGIFEQRGQEHHSGHPQHYHCQHNLNTTHGEQKHEESMLKETHGAALLDTRGNMRSLNTLYKSLTHNNESPRAGMNTGYQQIVSDS